MVTFHVVQHPELDVDVVVSALLNCGERSSFGPIIDSKILLQSSKRRKEAPNVVLARTPKGVYLVSGEGSKTEISLLLINQTFEVFLNVFQNKF